MGAMALTLAYGLEIQPRNDPYVAIAEEAIHTVAQAAVPGTYLVEVMPWLKYVPEWFPGAEFKRKARYLEELSEKFKNAPFDAVKEKMVCPPIVGIQSVRITECKSDIYIQPTDCGYCDPFVHLSVVGVR